MLAGCSGAGRGHCDQAALRAAVEATDRMLAAWQPASGVVPDYRLAERGLRAACPKLPVGFDGFLKFSVHPQAEIRTDVPLATPLWLDPDAIRPFVTHCPAYLDVFGVTYTQPAEERARTVYEGCRFADLGLATLAELPTSLGDSQGNSHALYLWLIEDGAEPEVARALVRPILFATDDALNGVIEFPQLPAVSHADPAAPAFTPTMFVAPDHVSFERERLTLTQGELASADHDGARVIALHRTLERAADRAREGASSQGPQPALRVVLAADPGLYWRTIGKLAWTAVEAGHPQIDVAVIGQDPLHPIRSLGLVVPGAAPIAELVLGAEKISLRCPGQARSPTLANLASELASCGDGPLSLAVADDTRWQRVVEVLAELAGKRTITRLARPGAAQLDSSEPVYIATDPGTVLRITDGAVTTLRTDDGGPAWRLGLDPEGVAYVLGFDRVYRIGDDALVPVTRDKAPTNGGSLIGFAPISDSEIWAYDEVTVVRWDGTRWEDLSPGPVAGFAAEFDVRHQMNGILVDRAGRVWASALRSLYLREGDAWRSMDPALGLKGAKIHDMFTDADGVVHLLLSTQAVVRVVPRPAASGRDEVTRVAPPPGSTWFDGEYAERATIVGPDGKRRSYLAGRDIPGRSVGHITGDAQGRLWAVTTSGLAVFASGDARRVWPVGTLPGLVGSPNDILARGRGPELLPLVDPPRTGGLRGVVYLGGLPLRNAAVELCPHALMIQPRPCEGSEPTFATKTTADGSWERRDLPLAAYWISVRTPEGWKIAFQATTRLKEAGNMKEGEVIDLGSLDVTGGMVAQVMPWDKNKKPRLTK